MKTTEEDKKVEATPLMEKDKQAEYDYPDYTEEEKRYISNTRKRLQNAHDVREAPHIEFDGMPYTMY